MSKRQSIVHQYRIIAKDAKQKWVIEIASPMFNNGGNSYVSNLIDVTELKQAELSGTKAEEKYRDLCENATDMIQCTAPSGLIEYTNSAWRQNIGYSQDETAGLSLFDIVPDDYKDYWLEVLNAVISREEPCYVDSVIISKSGNRINVQGTINCKFMDGKPVYTRGILRNVSKEKLELAHRDAALKRVSEIENKLEQSKREFEGFIHIASHDLREPLRKISSFGALLQEALEDKLDEDQAENLSFMTDGAKRMQTMIDDLLTLSRIATKAKPYQSIDMGAVVNNISKFELASMLEDTKGEILIPSPLLSICGDPSQMHQLFQNLIANGLKFHKENIPPRVTITNALTENNMVRFTIQDNGIGIDAKYHDQIFVMFKRLHSTNKYRGTGIGLAICKKIVERHSGEIGVTSRRAEGTSVWFTLPRFQHADQANTFPRGKK
jgi:PAS domain S-box-containing protein